MTVFPSVMSSFYLNFSTRPLRVFLFLSLLAALIYSDTFSASFHFDDRPNIVENFRIKDISNFLDVSGTRYVGFLSFALNYHFGGLNVFGYHLVNLLIHITNGFLVYNLVLLLFKASRPHSVPAESVEVATRLSLNTYSMDGEVVALATALLFVAHPIQTQAVTYIVQRFASLAALFYLLTVVCYLKWRSATMESKDRYLWYVGALISTVLAMKTKEISFTLPFMILLIEAAFFWSSASKRWMALIPFLLTLSIIPLSRVDALGEAEAGFVRETTEISRWDYLFTQFSVITTYLRLLVLPINQNLDYDYPIYHSLLDPPVLFSFLFLFSLFALTTYFLFSPRFTAHPLRLIIFGLFWFFLSLSVESSIIPIRDVIFEHRLYLPGIGIFLIGGVAIRWGLNVLLPNSRVLIGIMVVASLVAILSVTTYQRNKIWKDEITLWSDVILKSPIKARGFNNLGTGYTYVGEWEKAMQQYRTALRLKPDLAEVYNNIGFIYDAQGRLEEAVREYQTSLRVNPDYWKAHFNLARAYAKQGQMEEAIRENEIVLRLQPNIPEVYNNLGEAYRKLGRLEEALTAYRAALRLNPSFVSAYNNLGLAYLDLGQIGNAIQQYHIALKLDPNYAQAHYNLGLTYANQGMLDEARKEYQITIQLKQDYGEAYNNLGNIYYLQGKLDEAIEKYQTALRIAPNDAEVHYNLGVVYASLGKRAEAIKQYQEALKINSHFDAARQALESLSK